MLDSTRAGWTKACVTLLLLLLHALKFQKMVGELKKRRKLGHDKVVGGLLYLPVVGGTIFSDDEP